MFNFFQHISIYPKWEKGRQESGYYKFKIFSFWRADCYILKFPTHSEILPHVDKVDNNRHFRANIILRNAKKGGKFNCTKCIVDSKVLKVFRPDKYRHSVTEVTKGTRYILSIGWILNEKSKKHKHS